MHFFDIIESKHVEHEPLIVIQNQQILTLKTIEEIKNHMCLVFEEIKYYVRHPPNKKEWNNIECIEYNNNN